MALAAPPISGTTRTASIPAAAAVYWHLLSLDAPTVAALWCWGFARAAGVELPALAPLLLAAGTWLVYVADRILDGLDSANRERLRERHYFYLRYRRVFLAAGAAASPVFLWIVFTRMSALARREETAVFAASALYFVLVHVHGRAAERWLPKELAVGVLFAAATAVPAWARASGERLALAPLVMIFAMLCWLNCVAIESWESPAWTDSIHLTTAWATQHLRSLALGTVVLSLALAWFGPHARSRVCLLLASALSGFLLDWLAGRKRSLTSMQLRIGADAALLTPLLFLARMR